MLRGLSSPRPRGAFLYCASWTSRSWLTLPWILSIFPGKRPHNVYKFALGHIKRHWPATLLEPFYALNPPGTETACQTTWLPTHLINKRWVWSLPSLRQKTTLMQNILVKQPFYFMLKIAHAFKVKSHLKWPRQDYLDEKCLKTYYSCQTCHPQIIRSVQCQG